MTKNSASLSKKPNFGQNSADLDNSQDKKPQTSQFSFNSVINNSQQNNSQNNSIQKNQTKIPNSKIIPPIKNTNSQQNKSQIKQNIPSTDSNLAQKQNEIKPFVLQNKSKLQENIYTGETEKTNWTQELKTKINQSGKELEVLKNLEKSYNLPSFAKKQGNKAETENLQEFRQDNYNNQIENIEIPEHLQTEIIKTVDQKLEEIHKTGEELRQNRQNSPNQNSSNAKTQNSVPNLNFQDAVFGQNAVKSTGNANLNGTRKSSQIEENLQKIKEIGEQNRQQKINLEREKVENPNQNPNQNSDKLENLINSGQNVISAPKVSFGEYLENLRNNSQNGQNYNYNSTKKNPEIPKQNGQIGEKIGISSNNPQTEIKTTSLPKDLPKIGQELEIKTITKSGDSKNNLGLSLGNKEIKTTSLSRDSQDLPKLEPEKVNTVPKSFIERLDQIKDNLRAKMGITTVSRASLNLINTGISGLNDGLATELNLRGNLQEDFDASKILRFLQALAFSTGKNGQENLINKLGQFDGKFFESNPAFPFSGSGNLFDTFAALLERNEEFLPLICKKEITKENRGKYLSVIKNHLKDKENQRFWATIIFVSYQSGDDALVFGPLALLSSNYNKLPFVSNLISKSYGIFDGLEMTTNGGNRKFVNDFESQIRKTYDEIKIKETYGVSMSANPTDIGKSGPNFESLITYQFAHRMLKEVANSPKWSFLDKERSTTILPGTILEAETRFFICASSNNPVAITLIEAEIIKILAVWFAVKFRNFLAKLVDEQIIILQKEKRAKKGENNANLSASAVISGIALDKNAQTELEKVNKMQTDENSNNYSDYDNSAQSEFDKQAEIDATAAENYAQSENETHKKALARELQENQTIDQNKATNSTSNSKIHPAEIAAKREKERIEREFAKGKITQKQRDLQLQNIANSLTKQLQSYNSLNPNIALAIGLGAGALANSGNIAVGANVIRDLAGNIVNQGGKFTNQIYGQNNFSSSNNYNATGNWKEEQRSVQFKSPQIGENIGNFEDSLSYNSAGNFVAPQTRKKTQNQQVNLTEFGKIGAAQSSTSKGGLPSFGNQNSQNQSQSQNPNLSQQGLAVSGVNLTNGTGFGSGTGLGTGINFGANFENKQTNDPNSQIANLGANSQINGHSVAALLALAQINHKNHPNIDLSNSLRLSLAEILPHLSPEQLNNIVKHLLGLYNQKPNLGVISAAFNILETRFIAQKNHEKENQEETIAQNQSKSPTQIDNQKPNSNNNSQNSQNQNEQNSLPKKDQNSNNLDQNRIPTNEQNRLPNLTIPNNNSPQFSPNATNPLGFIPLSPNSVSDSKGKIPEKNSNLENIGGNNGNGNKNYNGNEDFGNGGNNRNNGNSQIENDKNDDNSNSFDQDNPQNNDFLSQANTNIVNALITYCSRKQFLKESEIFALEDENGKITGGYSICPESGNVQDVDKIVIKRYFELEETTDYGSTQKIESQGSVPQELLNLCKTSQYLQIFENARQKYNNEIAEKLNFSPKEENQDENGETRPSAGGIIPENEVDKTGQKENPEEKPQNGEIIPESEPDKTEGSWLGNQENYDTIGDKTGRQNVEEERKKREQKIKNEKQGNNQNGENSQNSNSQNSTSNNSQNAGQNSNNPNSLGNRFGSKIKNSEPVQKVLNSRAGRFVDNAWNKINQARQIMDDPAKFARDKVAEKLRDTVVKSGLQSLGSFGGSFAATIAGVLIFIFVIFLIIVGATAYSYCTKDPFAPIFNLTESSYQSLERAFGITPDDEKEKNILEKAAGFVIDRSGVGIVKGIYNAVTGAKIRVQSLTGKYIMKLCGISECYTGSNSPKDVRSGSSGNTDSALSGLKDVDCSTVAMLEALSVNESGGKYNLRFPSTVFTGNYHPGILGCGETSTGRACSDAAGKYQMISTTAISWAILANLIPTDKKAEAETVKDICNSSPNGSECLNRLPGVLKSFPFDPASQERMAASYLNKIVGKEIKDAGVDPDKVAKLFCPDGEGIKFKKSDSIAGQWASAPCGAQPIGNLKQYVAKFIEFRKQKCGSPALTQNNLTSPNPLQFFWPIEVQAAEDLTTQRTDLKQRFLNGKIRANYTVGASGLATDVDRLSPNSVKLLLALSDKYPNLAMNVMISGHSLGTQHEIGEAIDIGSFEAGKNNPEDIEVSKVIDFIKFAQSTGIIKQTGVPVKTPIETAALKAGIENFPDGPGHIHFGIIPEKTFDSTFASKSGTDTIIGGASSDNISQNCDCNKDGKSGVTTVAAKIVGTASGDLANKYKDAKISKTQEGQASFYGGTGDSSWNGRPTASGEIFDDKKFTAASNTLPLGTVVKVTNKTNGKSVIVKINDTGGFTELGRIIDLSHAAAVAIGSVDSGIVDVKVEVLGQETIANNISPFLPHPTEFFAKAWGGIEVSAVTKGEVIEYTGKDGVKVRGTLYTPDGFESTKYKENIVILGHDGFSGMGIDFYGKNLKTGQQIAEKGSPVFVMEYESGAASRGGPQIFSHDVDDTIQAMNMLQDRLKIKNNFTLAGSSRGAGVSVLAANQDPRVSQLVIAYPVSKISEWTLEKTSDLEVYSEALKRAGKTRASNLSGLSGLDLTNNPPANKNAEILLSYGDQDRVLLKGDANYLSNLQTYAASLKTKGYNIQTEVVAGGDHGYITVNSGLSTGEQKAQANFLNFAGGKGNAVTNTTGSVPRTVTGNNCNTFCEDTAGQLKRVRNGAVVVDSSIGDSIFANNSQTEIWNWGNFGEIWGGIEALAAFGNAPKSYAELSSGHKKFLEELVAERAKSGKKYTAYPDAKGPNAKMVEAFTAMKGKAADSGVNFEPIEFQQGTVGYRSYDDQILTFFDPTKITKIWSETLTETEKSEVKKQYLTRMEVSAPPSYSEHHTGLAIDIVTPGQVDLKNDNSTENNLYRWLQKNAKEFGFVQSYTSGSQGGAGEEQWHWRWDGTKITDPTNNRFPNNNPLPTDKPTTNSTLGADRKYKQCSEFGGTASGTGLTGGLGTDAIADASFVAEAKSLEAYRDDIAYAHTCYAAVWDMLKNNYAKNPTSPWGKLFPMLDSATASYANYATDFHKAMQLPDLSGKKTYQAIGLRNLVEEGIWDPNDRRVPAGAIIVIGSGGHVSHPAGDINVKSNDGRFINYGDMTPWMKKATKNEVLGIYIPK